MKRIALALLLSVLLACSFGLEVCAETVVKDGIEVTLTTDKENYDALDIIDARLTVRNTNEFAVENVSAQITAPEGYALSGSDEVKIGELSAGEVQIQQTDMHNESAEVPALPETGDDSHVVLWGILFVGSAVLCALAIRNPKAKRIVSLFLCIAMTGTMVLEAMPVVAAEKAQEESIAVTKEVTVDGKPVEITGSVKYASATTFALARTAEAPAEDFVYSIENGEVAIVGYKGTAADLVIPAYIDGYPVTSIGGGIPSYSSSYYSLKGYVWEDINYVTEDVYTLVLPDTVKRIEPSAFSSFVNLESVQFPNGTLEYIGSSAFNGCDSLKEIDIYAAGDLTISDATLEDYWGCAFAYCDMLEKVNIVCDGSLSITNYNMGTTNYATGNFRECVSLKEVDIAAKNNLEIGGGSFWNCEALETVVLDAKGEVQLNDYAFRGCSTLTSVTLPETTLNMGQAVFSNCLNLSELHMPMGLESINDPSYLTFMYTGYYAGGLTVYGYNGSYIDTFIEEYNKNINQDEEYPVKFVGTVYTCSHSKGNYTYEQNDTAAPKYTDNGDGLTHLVQPILNKYCVDCGTYVGNIVGTGTSYDHTMEDGVCSLCGYTENETPTACGHDGATSRLWYTEYLGNGVEAHIAKEIYYTGCGECGYNVDRVATLEKIEAHLYNEYGECTACGYVRGSNCVHESTMTDTYDTYAYAYDGATGEIHTEVHSVQEYHTVECLDCGVLISYETKTYLLDHVFSVEEQCVKCGYSAKSDCGHKTLTLDTYSTRYEVCADNVLMHNLIQEGTKTVCDSCGVVLEWNFVNIQKEHHTLENGICIFCDYAEDGEHIHQSDGGYVYLRDVIEEIPGDNSHHRVTAYIYETTCTICKEKYEVESSDGGVGRPAAPHDEDKHDAWKDGVCQTCWHKCTHNYAKVSTVTTNRYYDENEHQMYTIETQRCEYCKQENVIETPSDYRAAHVYSDGVCIAEGCGARLIPNTNESTGVNQGYYFAGDPYINLDYEGKEYPLLIPTYNEGAGSNSAETDGWKTVAIQEIELDYRGYSFDWASWIGGVQDIGKPIDDDDGSLPFGTKYSSGIAGIGVGNTKQIGYAGITILQMIESMYENTTMTSVRVVYQEKGNQRRAFFEVASVTGSQTRQDFDFVQALSNRGTSPIDPMYKKYGTRMLYDWRNIADEELRERFPDVEFKEGYVYNLKINYSEDWNKDKYFAHVGQDREGNWIYGYEIKPDDEYILIGTKPGLWEPEVHIVDITPRELTALELDKEGIRAIEDMCRQLD